MWDLNSCFSDERSKWFDTGSNQGEPLQSHYCHNMLLVRVVGDWSGGLSYIPHHQWSDNEWRHQGLLLFQGRTTCCQSLFTRQYLPQLLPHPLWAHSAVTDRSTGYCHGWVQESDVNPRAIYVERPHDSASANRDTEYRVAGWSERQWEYLWYGCEFLWTFFKNFTLHLKLKIWDLSYPQVLPSFALKFDLF